MSRILPGLILRPLGLIVRECSDAHEMTSLLSAHPAGCVILDIHMPSIDGYQTLKMIRSDPAYAHIRVYAYTSITKDSDHKRLMKAGFDGVIKKPMTARSLMTALQVGIPSHKASSKE